MVKLADIKEGDNILDIGCWNKELLEFLPLAKVTKFKGTEIEKYIVNYGRMFYPNYIGIDKGHNPTIRWDIEKGLPRQVMMSRFDVIFLGEVIEHIENFKTLLTQCREILKDGGRIILSTPLAWRLQWKTDTDHIHSFTPLNLRVLADQCGLKVTKIIGSFIHIPKLNIRINVDWYFYTNHLIVRYEKSYTKSNIVKSDTLVR